MAEKSECSKGMVFGRLTVVERVGSDGNRHALWLCSCECGGEKIVVASDLKRGHTKSCGCIREEKSLSNMTEGERFDKKSLSSMRDRWRHIISRTTNVNHRLYPNYGGRGITMCDEWKNSFETFLKDMGTPPFSGAHIDRIDNDLGYYKENCRWATVKQNLQNRGKRINSSALYKGIYKTKRLIEVWKAMIYDKNGKKIMIGVYDTQEEAGLAYNQKALELYGEYAYLNKI